MENQEHQSIHKIILGKFILFTIVAFVPFVVMYQLTTGIPNRTQAAAQERQEERVEEKITYLTSEAFSDFEINAIQWERRSQGGLFNAEADSYDVFLIETDDEKLERIAIHDTQINDQYYVRSYDKHTQGETNDR